MTTQEKRKYISKYCEWRGSFDQCKGCPLDKFESCQFNVLDFETLDSMHNEIQKELNKVAKSKRAKACDIPKRVKDAVWERDGGRCIICGSTTAMPNAHYISRSKGGLGIEENIVTLCTGLSENKCHYRFDFGSIEEKEEIGEKIKNYLKSRYLDWEEDKLVYRRF